MTAQIQDCCKFNDEDYTIIAMSDTVEFNPKNIWFISNDVMHCMSDRLLVWLRSKRKIFCFYPICISTINPDDITTLTESMFLRKSIP